MRRNPLVLLASLVFSVIWCAAVLAQNPNVPMPTLGGFQIWADEVTHAGWRIQHNVVTDHYRLLDDKNIRRAWGEYADCNSALEDAKSRLGLAYPSKHLVILVHGFGGRLGTLDKFHEPLREDGYATEAVAYPSTRQSVADHADGLVKVLTSLDGVKEVSFVTYSMGALVVRETLSRPEVKASGLVLNKIVMVAPPNQGLQLVSFIQDWWLYRVIATETGEDLKPNTASNLPLPNTPMGIVAGVSRNQEGFNPLLDGNDDGVVRLDETTLSGVQDWTTVEANHWNIDDKAETVTAVRKFFSSGHF